MAVWRTAPVTEQPELQLSQWQVMQTERGERHLVGWCIENLEGRVTSAIQNVDLSTRRAVTGSGRVYALVSTPGSNADAWYTWTRWCSLFGVTEVADVTDEVWAAIQAAGQQAAGE